MILPLAGRTAIVTGASQDPGLAIARRLLEGGARVMFADMDEAGLKAALAGLEDAPAVGRFHGDLRERLTLANLMSATIDRFDRIDILVNATRHRANPDTDAAGEMDEMIEQQIRHTLLTSVRMTQIAAKRMMTQAAAGPSGVIVNLTSIAARPVRPPLVGESVAAAALDQFTRAAALHLAPHGIRVNAVAAMPASAGGTGADILPATRPGGEGAAPALRPASAASIAESVLFLVSDAARAITGQILTLDGECALADPGPAPAG